MLYVTGAAILSAVCLNIVPKGKTKNAVRLICGLITMLCLAYPVANGMLDELDGFVLMDDKAESIIQEAEETEKVITRVVIEERYGAYILDKGKEIGVDIVSADVAVRWNENGYWYPVSAEIRTGENITDNEELTNIISEELGIDRSEIY